MAEFVAKVRPSPLGCGYLQKAIFAKFFVAIPTPACYYTNRILGNFRKIGLLRVKGAVFSKTDGFVILSQYFPGKTVIMQL